MGNSSRDLIVIKDEERPSEEISILTGIDPEPENRHENHSFGESMVHQSIETIEFILGSVSNTASYLRLWALSLAHSQLAKVFMDMLIFPYLQGNSIGWDFLIIVVMLVIWFLITIGVIMIMDFMECCLHALRLQWVEF